MNQIIGICGELKGYWESVDDSLNCAQNGEYDTQTDENRFEQWSNKLVDKLNQCKGKMGILYCDSLFGNNSNERTKEANKEWSILQNGYQTCSLKQKLEFCEEIIQSGHYLHIEKSDVVVEYLCKLMR